MSEPTTTPNSEPIENRWWAGPLATFDTETTGTDVENDRIVTGVLDIYDEDGRTASLSLMLNPGIEIPEAATLVHGITTEQAQTDGIAPVTALSRLVAGFAAVWAQGIPVVVYNAAYDFTILDRECRRHLGIPFQVDGPVIDPLVIDKHLNRYVKGSRRLDATCLRYGVELDNAHNAEADACAALMLARAIGSKYDMQMPRTLSELYRWQQTLRRDQSASYQGYLAGKGTTNDDGSPIVINGEWPMQAWVDPDLPDA